MDEACRRRKNIVMTPITRNRSAEKFAAREGWFLRMETPLWEAVVPTVNNQLPSQKPVLNYKGPRISRTDWEAALNFFRAVHQQHGAEAKLYVYFRDGAFLLDAPLQIVTGASVEAEAPNPLLGRVAGSVHSHGDMDSFWSSTDTDDQLKGPDGVHIVVGKIHQVAPPIKACVVVQGYRFDVKPHVVIDIPETKPYQSDWLRAVRVPKRLPRAKVEQQALPTIWYGHDSE